MRVILSFLTFSPETAFGRIVIFDGGMESIRDNPIFGIGFGEWDHPTWMSNSIDNFWLVVPVMYGVPAFAGLAGAVIYSIIGVFRSPNRGGQRKAWLVSMLGFAVAACTVHFWNAVFVYFCFLLGAGSWMLDVFVKRTRQGDANANGSQVASSAHCSTL
jgi:O-antigen ligase